MDIERLMTQQGMRDWTDEQRDTWTNDAVQMRQAAQIIQVRLANTRIDGDNTGTAARRARKVVRPLIQAARQLEKAAARIEGANAIYLREVLELPDRRAKDLERKALRRQKLGIAATSTHTAIGESLTQSTHALHHGTPVGNPQVNPVQAQPVYTHPQHFNYAPQHTGQAIPSIGDLFDQEAM